MFKKLLRLQDLKNEKGNVLLTVLVVFAVGAILIVPVISLMVGGLNAGQIVEEDMGELYAADSGVEYAMYYIMNNPDSLPTADNPILDIPFNNSVNDVMVNVRCEFIETNKYLIIADTSDADTGDDLVSINSFIELVLDGEGGGGTVTAVFNNAITTLGGGVTASGAALITGSVFSNGNINMSGSAQIAGSVYAETNIGIGPAAYIDGDAYAQGTIQRPQNVTGTANAGAANQDIDPLSDEVVNSVINGIITASNFTPVAAGPVTHTGNTTFQPWWPPPSSLFTSAVNVNGNLNINNATNLTFNQSVHVSGNLVINASGKTIIFNGPVVVNGSITLQNGGSATAEFNGDVKVVNNLDLGSGGDVSFGGTIYVGGNFAASGDRKIEISSDVYVGGDLTLNGSSAIEGGHTFVVMGDVELCGATKLADQDIPFLLVPTGDVDLTGSSYISAVVYAPEADVSYGGDITLYGSLVCNSLSMTGSAKIEYAEGVI
jgi:cytoskeletal protein CcmA (bactofilin family)